MKNKGFTLVELILVVVILGILSAIVIPGIMKSLNESRRDSGESIEKILKENLELYNIDHKDDIWCSENSKDDGLENDSGLNTNCKKPGDSIIVSVSDLYSTNPDIDMGECLLQNPNSLKVTMDKSGDKFKYEVKIVCGKDIEDSSGNKIIENWDTAKSIYYETK